MTRLDYADLCAIETTLCLRPDVFDDTTRDLVQALVDNLKEARAQAERAAEMVDEAIDHARDADVALSWLRDYLDDAPIAPIAADKAADAIEQELAGILKLDVGTLR